jgi:hypothetical protein
MAPSPIQWSAGNARHAHRNRLGRLLRSRNSIDRDPFELTAPLEVAAIYWRLRRSTIVWDLKAKLKRRGVTDANFNVLLQKISELPLTWKSLVHSRALARTAKLSQMAKHLRRLAKIAELDGELRTFPVRLDMSERNSGSSMCFYPLGAFLLSAAAQIDASRERIESLKHQSTSVRSEQSRKLRNRTITRKSFVVLGIYNAVHEQLRSTAHSQKASRPLNKECAAVAEIVLSDRVRTYDISRLRKGKGKQHHR